MISKGKAKTVTEKEWLNEVLHFANDSNFLALTYGDFCESPYLFQIDHIIGAQAKRKVNGVSMKVGEFAIMPIPVEIHDITSNNPINRTLRPKSFRDQFGCEKQLWRKMLSKMESDDYTIPFSQEVIAGVLR